jgi:flavin-dependent dehydrogenase
VAAGRLFVIGDAAGYVEPFTGEGIACALDAGRAVAVLAIPAVTHWSADMIETWTDTVRIGIQRRWRAATLMAYAVRRPLVVTAATALLSRYPGLATPAVAYVHATRQGGLL